MTDIRSTDEFVMTNVVARQVRFVGKIAWGGGDYMQFIVMFSVGTSFVTRIFSFSTVYAEIIGSISVMVEAIILVPQSIQNYERQSTEGLSYAMCSCYSASGNFEQQCANTNQYATTCCESGVL